MTEDVSALARLSVTLVLLAMNMAVVLNLAVIAFAQMSAFTYNITEVSSTIQSSTIHSVVNEYRLPAPVVYRVLELYAGNIDTLTIRYLDGTTSSNLIDLLYKADKYVTVEIKDIVTSKGYIITVLEVE